MNTEAQAKGLWCPMVRHTVDDAGTFNRGARDGQHLNADTPETQPIIRGLFVCNCIASSCAMWRWAEVQPERRFIRCSIAHQTDQPLDEKRKRGLGEDWVWFGYSIEDECYEAGWWESQDFVNARRLGYCGLAGSPA